MKCELCSRRAGRKRLCPSCRNMIVRLQQVWHDMGIAERGAMLWASMEQPRRQVMPLGAAVALPRRLRVQQGSPGRE